MMPTEPSVLDDLPPKLVSKLMPFQREGVEFAIKKNGRCLIADEMGLGKTLQALCVAYYYREEWPLLLVVPSSLRYCWLEELERWLPEVPPQDINLIQAGNDAGGIATARVTVVTYGMLSRQTSRVVVEALAKRRFQVIICDESHYIRNAKTQACKAVCPLVKAAKRRLLLSGTPALARPAELYPQLDALCPGEFGSWWKFTEHYCNAHFQYFGRIKRRVVDGASNLEELQSKLTEKVMIRREKKDVLKQLPPKQRQKVIFELRDSSIRRDIQKSFEELKPLLKKGSSPVAQVMAADLVEVDSDQTGSTKTLGMIQSLVKLTAEAKLGPVREYIDMLCENNDLKFLVFAYHHLMMDGIQQTLYDRKVKFVRIDGQTPPAERQRFVQQFQSDPNTRVAILSILASGVGLTLTAAKLVVFAELYWTPGVMVQCEDRAHRIGQTSCVPVHYLVAKATMDEWLWSAVCRKTMVTTKALSGRQGTLEAQAGDKFQVDLLSNAEAWRPTDNADVDISSLVLTQTPPGQTSILDFFGKSAKNKASKDKGAKSNPFALKNRQKQSNNSNQPEQVVLIDSDSDSEVFCNKKKKLKKFTLLQDHHEKSTGVCRKKVKKHPSCLDLLESTYSKKPSDDECSVSSVPSDRSDQIIVTTDSQDTDEYDFESSEYKPKKSRKKEKGAPLKKLKRTRKKFGSQEEYSIDSEPGDDFDAAGLSNTSLHGNKGVKGQSSDKAVGSEVDEPEQWSCVTCTFLNHKDLPFCEVCDTPKKPETRPSAQTQKCDTRKEKTRRKKFLVSSGPTLQINSSKKISVHRDSSEANSSGLNEAPKSEESLLPTNEKAETSQGQGLSHTEKDGDLERSECVSPDLFTSDPSPSSPPSLNDNGDASQSSQEDTLLGPEATESDTEWEADEGEGSSDSVGGGLTNVKPAAVPNSPRLAAFESEDDLPQLSFSRGQRTKEEGGPTVAKRRRLSGELDSSQSSSGASSLQQQQQQSSILSSTNDTDADVESSVENEEKDAPSGHSNQSACLEAETSGVKSLQFQCSKFTGRVFLHDQDGQSMGANFLPLDLEVGNLDDLPLFLHRPPFLQALQRFVREWNSMSETKRRLIIKQGVIFTSPLQAYAQIRQETSTTQRHKTKLDTAKQAHHTAAAIGGSVREVLRPGKQRKLEALCSYSYGKSKGSEDQDANLPSTSIADLPSEPSNNTPGLLQAVSSTGVPLCLQCGGEYQNPLLDPATITNPRNAWQTRFCSWTCADKYWLQTRSGYCREEVFRAEHGLCQLCGVDAQAVFCRIRDTPDIKQRLAVLKTSCFGKLTVKLREQMIRGPKEGQFWQVDHIRPVWEGGGMCDIDNLRTLCTVCHQKVTAEQAAKRSRMRKLTDATQTTDITAFFQRS